MKQFYNFLIVAVLSLFGNNLLFGQLIFSEDFSSGTGTTPPTGWNNNDIAGGGGFWDFSNPGSRTINSPMSNPAAIFDSDDFCSGPDEAALESPSFDASVITGNIYLSFDHYFNDGFGGAYDVEVFDGTTWNSVLSGTTETANPKSEVIDITSATGSSNVSQVRFHWTGSCSWYWIVDNVKIYTLPTSPTLTQDPATPDCVVGTNITATGSPETGVEWYWQTSATGTSTANAYTGTLNVMNNGTYYIRAYVPSLDQWVTAESIDVTNIPVAATPPSPVATVEPSCVTTGSELTVPLTGNSDLTYYWQGTTMNGVSTTDVAATDVATTPYMAPASGTYYVSAFDASTSCWSLTSSVTVTVQTAVPAAPTASVSEYNICGGLSDFDITATAPASALTAIQSTSFGTNLISTGTGTNSIPLVVPALPAGAVVSSARLLLNNVSTLNGSWRSEIRVALSGMFTLAPTQISTLGSAGTISPNPIINLTGFPSNGGALNLDLTETYNDTGDDANFGEVILEVTYSLPSDINWYDASTAGSQIGTGSPFDCIGNSVLSDPSSNGTYEFYAESVDGACSSATRTLVTVNVVDVSVVITPMDETCIGYANGTFEISDTLCGTTPFLVDVDGGGFGPIPTNLTPGTYTITVQDAAMNESAPVDITIGSTSTYIPDAPTAAVNQYNICSGETSQMIEATATGSGSVTIPLATNYTLNTGATGVFNGNLSIPAGATISSATITFDNMTSGTSFSETWFSDVDFNMTGAITKPITSLTGSGANVGPQIYNVNANPLGGAFTLNLTDTYGGSSTFYGSITVDVSYTLPAATIEWYDAATNGNLEGTGSPFESIGTNVLPTPATNGSYEFYAGAISGGCYSIDRTLVTVNVNDVNVELTAIDASCNGSATGSFDISDTLCGITPFLVDVDGGGFGPIPTDLVAGTYQITIQDDNGANSPTYTLVINEAGAPSDAYMEDITDNGGQVSWNANGNETEWNVEWGLPGFTPGTGTEIGSTQAMDTFAIITGLDANTNYDVYVSANCGAGSTTGDWDMVNWTTDCGVYGLPFIETFEDNSESRPCWYNINEVGTSDWTYETGNGWGVNINNAFEGTKNAKFVLEPTYGEPITKLASPRFDFAGQDSVAVIFSYSQEEDIEWSDWNETKVYTTGASGVWTEVMHYTAPTINWVTDTIFVSDTTTQIAFEGINEWGPANTVDYVQVLPCNLNSGTDGSADVCRADGTFDLNSVVTLGETFGKWTFAQNPSAINGSILDVTALPTGTFNFYYIVQTPCAVDTTIATLTIFPPSSAGVDGTITACRNEPIYLLSGLSGTVDLGGQWYNTANNPIGVNVTTSNIPGNYNFDYVVSNGVCPNDTANILVTVGTCDYLDVQELVFGDMNVYPNPTEDLVFITTGSSETFSYELLDVKGQLLSSKEAAINGTKTTEISFENLEPGVYMIRVYNSEAEKTFRIVKQ